MSDARRDSRAVRRIEWEEFARGHIGPEERPVEPRPASTIVLAREAAPEVAGFEVLLLRRPDSARFAAGAYVFPGGVIEPADDDSTLLARLTDDRGAPPREAGALAAGIRELFEETGILPADRPPPRPEASRARASLLRDEVALAEVASRLELSFHRLRSAYIARWITPEALSRRYDTRFFLLLPGDEGWSEPELTPEHTAWLWATPREAVERFHRGRLPMLFPTWKTLESLAGYRRAASAIAELSERDVEPIRPRLIVEEGTVRPALPGEPGYARGR